MASSTGDRLAAVGIVVAVIGVVVSVTVPEVRCNLGFEDCPPGQPQPPAPSAQPSAPAFPPLDLNGSSWEGTRTYSETVGPPNTNNSSPLDIVFRSGSTFVHQKLSSGDTVTYNCTWTAPPLIYVECLSRTFPNNRSLKTHYVLVLKTSSAGSALDGSMRDVDDPNQESTVHLTRSR
jgi:hypothetical protein